LLPGGNAYYLAKFAGIFKLDMQDIGAQQTGMTKDEFKAKLVAATWACSKPNPIRSKTTWHNSLAASARLTFPLLAAPSTRACSKRRTGNRSFDGFPPIHAWLGEKKPDVMVIFYNDHGLNFFLDKMPTFAVGAAAQYVNSDEGWGIPVAGAAARARWTCRGTSSTR
jgi:hypothetical protein